MNLELQFLRLRIEIAFWALFVALLCTNAGVTWFGVSVRTVILIGLIVCTVLSHLVSKCAAKPSNNQSPPFP